MTVGAGLVVNGRYKILSKLGEGGFASVYLAEDLELGRQAAVKFLHSDTFADEEDLLRFQREARMLGRLVHPNIVSAYAFGYAELSSDNEAQGATPFIVMELLEGESLASLLRKVGSLGADACINIFSQVASGLQFAHDAGIIHRDLNTGNIFLINEGNKFRVKLIDFGISHLRSESSSTNKLTKTGFLIGTPQYMSPELAAGQKAAVSSDIYSFGCVLYECLSGKLPLDADNAIGVLFKQRNEYPNRIELDWNDQKIATSLKQLTLRCLQKEPEKRYQSCEEIVRDLADIAQGVEISVPGDLHQWADAKIEKSEKAVSLKFAFVVSSVLIAVIVLLGCRVALLEALYQPFVSLNFPAALVARASYFDLLQAMRSAKAGLFAEKIAEQYGANSEFLLERNWLLKAADAYYGKKHLDSAMECLNRAIKINEKISDKSQRVELYKYAMRLIDLYQRQSPAWPEIEARSQLVLQASKDNFSGGMPRIYNEFVSRTDQYIGFTGDSADLMDALLVPLEKRQVLIHPDLETKLSSIVGFLPFVEKYVHGELKNARFVEAVLRNRGLSSQYRGTMELAEIQLKFKGTPRLEEKKLVEFASKRESNSDLFKFTLNLRLAELYLRMADMEKARQATLVASEYGKVLNLDYAPLTLEYLIRSKSKCALQEFVSETIDRLELTIHVHKSEKTAEQAIYSRMAATSSSAFNEQQSILRRMRTAAATFQASDIEQEISETLPRWREKYHLSSVSSPALTFANNGHLSSFSRNFYSLCVEENLEQAEKLLLKFALGSKGDERADLLKICLYTSNTLSNMERPLDSYRVLCYGSEILDPSIAFQIDSFAEFLEKYCIASRFMKITIQSSEWKRLADTLVASISAPGLKVSEQSRCRIFQSIANLAEASLWNEQMDEALKFLVKFKKVAIKAGIFDAYSIYYDRAFSIIVSRMPGDLETYRDEVKSASESCIGFVRHPVRLPGLSDLFFKDVAGDLFIGCRRVALDSEAQKIENEWRLYLEKEGRSKSQLWKEFLFVQARLAPFLEGEKLLDFGNSYLNSIEGNLPDMENPSMISTCFLPGQWMGMKGFTQAAEKYSVKVKTLLQQNKLFSPAVALAWFDVFPASKNIQSKREVIDNFKELFEIVDGSGQNLLKANARVALAIHLCRRGYTEEAHRYFLDAADRFKAVEPQHRATYAVQCYLNLASLEASPTQSLRYLHEGLVVMSGIDHGWSEMSQYKEQLIHSLRAAGHKDRAQILANSAIVDLGLMLLLSRQ